MITYQKLSESIGYPYSVWERYDNMTVYAFVANGVIFHVDVYHEPGTESFTVELQSTVNGIHQHKDMGFAGYKALATVGQICRDMFRNPTVRHLIFRPFNSKVARAWNTMCQTMVDQYGYELSYAAKDHIIKLSKPDVTVGHRF